MVSQRVERLLHEELEKLPEALQERVLEFARGLQQQRPRGVSGKSLLRFAGALALDDAAEMSRAIEEDCERIDPNGW